MKKRILSMLLAVVMIVTLLPLGLVEPAEAVETLDTQRRAVTERAQEYIAACNNFSAQNGQSIPYWTISDAEFESYVQTKTRDKAAETSKLKKQVDAGDFMSALTTKTCTGSNGSHQWSNEKYTCRSHYFSGLDNRGGGYSQCQGFANYMAYVLFGEAGTSESNFTKMTQVGYGFDFQPGDVLRVLDSNGKNGHSMVVYEGSGSSAKVIECNWGHSSRGYCNVRWDLTVAQKQKQFPTVETVWRPNASLAVTPGGTDSGGGTTEDVIGSGNCGANGANVTWKLTSDGTLTISGTGKMADYEWEGTPWYDLRSQVKKAIIKNGVTSIGSYAFCWCENLTSVTIPDSVTTISESAFESCSSLSSVTIPDSVTSIGDSAFWCCTNLTSVTIPSSVTSIGSGAFSGSGLTSVTIPGSVTSIGSGAFSGSGLTSVTIPNSVTSIGSGAFSGTSLTSVTIPNSVDCIYSSTFANCTSLTSLTIPNSVTAIYDNAFFGCTSLTSVVIPEGVTRVETCAFYGCTSLTSVVIPEGVTRVETCAFYGCTSLTSVTIPNSVISIGNYAFYNCSSLTSVTIPNSVTSIGSYAFEGCTSLTSVTIPYGVKDIGAYAFCLCQELSSVTIPDSVTTISESAFYYCTSLTSVTIPDGVTSIGNYAFSCCSSLTNVTIPKSVTSIGEGAFYNCSSLTSVTIPKSVTRIDEKAFYYCDSLTDVYYGGYGLDWLAMDDHGDIPDSATVHFKGDLYGKGACGTNVNWVMTGDGTLTISGTGAMANYEWHGAPWYGARSQVKTVIIKNSVTSIGNNAFSGCSSLTSVTIPNSVTSIGANAFWSCSSLTDVTIPNSVTSIGSCAFAGCSSLTSVAIPNSITSIGAYAFNGCSALTSVTIPKSVTSIGEGAFYNCSSLTRVTIPNSVTSIGNYAFSCCSSLTNVTIPKSVTSIGEGAFYNCSSLTSVTIPKSVTRIDEKAFYYCDSLTDVYYGGTKADWKKITIKDGNEDLRNATLHAKPAAPADVKLTGAKAVNGGIQVTWQAAAGAAQYRVYRKDAANPKWTVLTSSATGTSYVDKTAKAGVKYTYTVRGINKDGVLSPSYDGHGVSATIPKTNAPANVTLTGAKVVTGGIQVTWKAASGATKYRVYRKDATNTGWKALTSSATGTSFLDKTAVAGVKYTYTVRGIAKDGKTLSSGFDGNGVSAVIKPAKVVLVSARADSAGILVTWQKAAGAHSYQVFRKTANTGWQRIAKNIHDTEWKDIDAVKGTKYIYTVRAVADDGTTRGAYDKTGKTATVTKNPTTPADVTLGKAVAGKSGITVTWSYAADARMYRVYRKAAGETKWTVVKKNAEGKSWTDKNVTKGVKYTYTVRGVNANGVLSSRYNGTGVSAIAK